ncbi:MAG: hypothetical protein J7K61_01350 [Thermoplasmata archaeon]|nr:hypothetical protein [Thermoplasmata archaeon]
MIEMDEEIARERIRNLLTPEIAVCKPCREKYNELASCSVCGKNLLDPEYKGMVYECPICGNLFCEDCWKKMEAGEINHSHQPQQMEQKSTPIFK